LDWLGRPGVVTPLDRAPESDRVRRAPRSNVAPHLLAAAATVAATAAASKSADKTPPAPAAEKSAKSSSPGKPKKKRPGSGLEPRKSIVILRWARRICQAVCLLTFLYLLANTAFRGTFAAKSGEAVRLPWPVELFLSLDPFVAFMTALSTHTVYRGLLLSLIILTITVVVGRAFCGWICPFGTIHHFVAWMFPSRYLRGGKRVESNRTKSWQIGKYYILLASLGAALFGSAIGGLLDPICVAVRAIGLGVIPALQYLGIRTTDLLGRSNVPAIQVPADAVSDYLAKSLWTANQSYYNEAWFILTLFIAILFMNRIIPRFWCRALCPLGAFLGVLSRFSIVGMHKDHAKCTDCNLCIVHCQGADSPQGGVKHRQEECHLCLNCETACPEGVITWKFFPNLRSSAKTPDLDRRTALASAMAGAVALPALRIANWPDKAYSPKVIRPPGSVEERAFLERCIRCAECMKVCPNNALHPALFEAGVEGLWTPILIPRIGYCEHSCVLCGQVCPTGAIQKIDEKAKLGIGQPPIRIGTAMYDHGRCLPWAMATPCIVCEEFCPTSPKAIWVEEVTIPKRDAKVPAEGGHPRMGEVKVQRPHVDPSLCIGCGACEKVCPVVDKPAVYVTSAGESRSKTNVILLENTGYSQS
jgi:polyferredoxin